MTQHKLGDKFTAKPNGSENTAVGEFSSYYDSDEYCFHDTEGVHWSIRDVTFDNDKKEVMMEPFKNGDKVRSLVGTIIMNDDEPDYQGEHHLYRVQFDVTNPEGQKFNRVMRRDLLELVEAYVASPNPGEIWLNSGKQEYIFLEAGEGGFEHLWWDTLNSFSILFPANAINHWTRKEDDRGEV